MLEDLKLTFLQMEQEAIQTLTYSSSCMKWRNVYVTKKCHRETNPLPCSCHNVHGNWSGCFNALWGTKIVKAFRSATAPEETAYLKDMVTMTRTTALATQTVLLITRAFACLLCVLTVPSIVSMNAITRGMQVEPIVVVKMMLITFVKKLTLPGQTPMTQRILRGTHRLSRHRAWK